MPELYDGMLLYHGSYCEVKTPILDKCAAFKDFGKLTYLIGAYGEIGGPSYIVDMYKEERRNNK
ncbi:MAG: DUF3990 domain-containing protein [Butyrivibrio sp.]|nr:DUF3990 domain-containing protein [Acetatifactor muris]MCM1558963.1 DUF3990 domain-containing protein [Butyrivibrio sp.]